MSLIRVHAFNTNFKEKISVQWLFKYEDAIINFKSFIKFLWINCLYIYRLTNILLLSKKSCKNKWFVQSFVQGISNIIRKLLMVINYLKYLYLTYLRFSFDKHYDMQVENTFLEGDSLN